jgi:hypothetical protein
MVCDTKWINIVPTNRTREVMIRITLLIVRINTDNSSPDYAAYEAEDIR